MWHAREHVDPSTPRRDAANDHDDGPAPRFELRYRSISTHRCGYAFACNADGDVDLDALSDRARENYLYARAMVGLDLLTPEVQRVD